MLKAADLARLVQTKLGCGYVYSALGQTISEAHIQAFAKMYPSMYTQTYIDKCRKNIGKQSFDCVGLIKFFVWGNTDKLGGYNSATDISANDSYSKATAKGSIGSIPETTGVCVRFDGHIGVYIGGGYVVEAKGVDYGVVKTKLSEGRWTHWMQYPGVEYSVAPVAKPTLRKGSKGSDVKILQQRLLVLGYKLPKYGADSDFGSETDATVRAFQKANGLVVDGIVGSNTWGALS